ncbi:MAG: SurA N-terminal domain-containing protein [Pseudomonadota bacterium]
MLDALRRGATGWVAKALLSVLILSFAVWGVADVFTGYGRGALATVGDVKITPEEFQQSYQQQLNAISYQAGRRLTPEQARSLGLDTRVLTQLVGSAAVENHAAKLDLALSEKAVAESLQRDAAFKGPDGKFSRAKLENVMQQLGVSERGLIALRRKDDLREQITGALETAIVVPKAVVDVQHAYREETRTIEHVTLDADKLVKLSEPDEEKLKATYEQGKAQFMTPELRKLAALILDIGQLSKAIEVPEAEIRAAYEQEKDSYDTPEKRRVQQVAFADKAAAEAARKAIEGGQSFADAAKEAGAKETDIDLGLLQKRQMIDPKIADAAFSLEKDNVSPVIEGRFATVLLRVTAIEPGVTRSFADVKDQVRDKLARERALAEMQKRHDEVDDGRAAGRPLAEIGKGLGLDYIEIEAVDQDNKTPDGKTGLDSPHAASIVASGFAGAVGLEQAPIELGDGGAAWVDVLAVTAPKQKPFEEVKDAVKALWTENERRRQLNEAASGFAARVRKGEPMAKIAEEATGKLVTTLPVTRATVPEGLTKPAIAQAFALPAGGVGTTDSADGRSRIVFRVVDIKQAPEPTKEQAAALAKELGEEMRDDVMSEYVGALKRSLGVTINEEAFRRLTGAGNEP